MDDSQENLRRLGVIWVLDLDENPPRVRPRLPASFERLGSQHAAMLGSVDSGTESGTDRSAEFAARFASGRQCYAARVAAALAAYGWVSFEDESIGELGLHLRLLPGEAYIFDCVTLPNFRQRYLYSALLSYILGELRQQNICRAWIGADYDNEPSQRGIARAGFHPVADIVTRGSRVPKNLQVQERSGVPEILVVQACRVFMSDSN